MVFLTALLLTLAGGCSAPPERASAPPPSAPPPYEEKDSAQPVREDASPPPVMLVEPPSDPESLFGTNLPEKFETLGFEPRFDPDSDYGGIIHRRHPEYRVVRVFYGTDRARSGTSEPSQFYDASRGSLEFGSALVSIPENHRPGALEAPSIWRLEFREDPTKHVVLMNVIPTDREIVMRQMGDIADNLGRNDVFLFVHGFNQSFTDAARRAAQLSHDLAFPGIPFLYSWPSQGSLAPLAYTADLASATWTADNLKQVLRTLDANERLGSIHLVAHSMGNHAVLTALTQLAKEPDFPRVRTLVLAAPDYDADIFQRDVAGILHKVSEQTILYASSDDRALQVSRNVWNSHRLGDTGANIVVAPGIDTIDTSGVDLTMLGHSYYGSVKNVMEDLSTAITQRLPPAQRKLIQRSHPAGIFWAISE